MKIQIAKAFRKNQRGAIRAAITVAAHHFPMPPRLDVVSLPRVLWDHDLTDEPVEGMAEPRKIWLSPALRDDALFFAASHEARHVSDYHTGKLEYDGKRAFWNGRKVDGRTAYAKLPYERVAFAYEARLGFKGKRG